MVCHHTEAVNGLIYKVEQADVVALCWRGREVVRRIFVTVRDRNWQEIPPSEWRSEEKSRAQRTFWARHVSDLVDFEWQGALEIDGEGTTVRFSFEGHAHRDMEVCRLGLVVLHPVVPLIGTHVTATGPAGSQEITISSELHPQPIVQGVSAAMTHPFSELSMQLPGVGPVKLRFTGDLFELEDQRNWGDASFKSYCTPLRLGFPREIAAGTVIKHSVEITLNPLTAAAAEVAAERRIPSTLTSNRSDEGARRFPTLGRIAPASAKAADGWGAHGWHHARLDMAAPRQAAALEDALHLLPKNTKVELCIAIDEQSRVATEFSDWVEKYTERISAILLRGTSSPLPARDAVMALRSALQGRLASGVPLLAVPNGYFVEFNRAIPFDLPIDGIAFPLSATVHSDDRLTIADNVPAVADMVRTARHLTCCSHIAVSPLALYYPPTTRSQFPSPLIAPWLVATLAHAADAGVATVTLADDVVEALTTSAEGEDLLQQLIDFAYCNVRVMRVSADARMHALAVERDNDLIDVLISNLGEEISHFELGSQCGRISVNPQSVVKTTLPATLLECHRTDRDEQ